VHRDEPLVPDGIRVELARLLELAVLAVPTCLGVSLVVGEASPALTLSCLRPAAASHPVLSSVAVRLPRPLASTEGVVPAELRIYASVRDAFAAAVPSLLSLLDMRAGRITVDAHLELPDLNAEMTTLSRWLAAQAVVGRAIGVLLDRGLSPHDGHAELARLADLAGTSVFTAACAVVASTTGEVDPL
jgi:hypothetical protein